MIIEINDRWFSQISKLFRIGFENKKFYPIFFSLRLHSEEKNDKMKKTSSKFSAK